jgi:protocatechuate 3,4-dioxygenase beta subunit
MTSEPVEPTEDARDAAFRWPAYASNRTRAPLQDPVPLPETALEYGGPTWVGPRIDVGVDDDLTSQHSAAPVGQRIIIHGRLTSDGRPVTNGLIEIWQANAAGRYAHPGDDWDAPLDPNFTGSGRCSTDDDGRYRFVTIRPGAYPWRNHHNAWRPAHIHLSVLGPSFATRLVTQMYFPDDPLLASDPIFQSVRDPDARQMLVAHLDWDATEPAWALAYRFDIVLGDSTRTGDRAR